METVKKLAEDIGIRLVRTLPPSTAAQHDDRCTLCKARQTCLSMCMQGVMHERTCGSKAVPLQVCLHSNLPDKAYLQRPAGIFLVPADMLCWAHVNGIINVLHKDALVPLSRAWQSLIMPEDAYA